MYHPRFKGRHYDMGLKLGNILKRANIKFPIQLDDFHSDFGKKSGILLKSYFPEGAEEIRGITDVIGFDNEMFTSWMMCMGCCMYPEDAKGKRFIVTVNHFVTEEMRIYDATSGKGEFFSHERYMTAYNALKNQEAGDNIMFSKELLSGKYGFMCQYNKNLNFDTIWSSIFDLTNSKVYRSEGNPKQTKFIEDERFEKIIKSEPVKNFV